MEGRKREITLSYPRFEGAHVGMLHTWLAKPRNRLFRRALAMRAMLWVPVLVCASMATQATFVMTLAALWRVS